MYFEEISFCENCIKAAFACLGSAVVFSILANFTSIVSSCICLAALAIPAAAVFIGCKIVDLFLNI